MGVEKLFNSLEKNEKLQKDGIMLSFENTLQTEYLFDDFNSIIYTVASSIEKELNFLLYTIILQQHNVEIEDALLASANEYANKWNFTVDKADINKYKSYFTSDLIDRTALTRIKEFTYYKCKTLNDPNMLKIYMISIDGVPQMAKEGEQKKRRFNGTVISELKKKIREKYSDNIPQLRHLYETNKITYDRGKIISWTSFMKSIEEMLTSDDLLDELKIICPNLEKMIVSHQNVCGEGEKKIMEFILENRLSGNYTIISPDTDTIMLGIIAQNKLSNMDIVSKFTILRYNQQSDKYDVINVDSLCNNMYNYVSERVKSSEITKNGVTNDIAFIFTLFGNDFLPKVESIDVRNDIDTLLDIYCNVMNRAMKKCLTYKSNTTSQLRINYYNFTEFIKEIANIESSLLNETFMANKYKNYSYLKRELRVNRLMPILKNYITTANELFNKLRNSKNGSEYTDVEKIASDYANDLTFMEQFLIFENSNYKRDDHGNIIDIFDKFKFQVGKVVKYFAENGKDIRGKQILQPHENQDKLSNFHLRNITESLSHPMMDVTDYDIESYKLERRLGEYEAKLNANDFELGSMKLAYDSTGNYVIKFFPRHEGVKKYYKSFFDIDHEVKTINIKGTPKQVVMFEDNKINELVENYIKGLFWVFDNYFNKNDSDYNSTNVSIWIYPYHRSPLMYQIKEILCKIANSGKTEFINKMNSLYNDVALNDEYFVTRDKFMNKLEHYLYVTPYENHVELPEKYKSFVENNRDLFPNLTNIAHQIWSNNDNSNLIDCRRVSYVNKCNLLCIKFISFDEYMKRISHLRESDDCKKSENHFEKNYLSDDISIESTTDSEDNVCAVNNIQLPIETCKKMFNDDEFVKTFEMADEYRQFYKNQYLETRDKKYKKYYKKIKKILQQQINDKLSL